MSNSPASEPRQVLNQFGMSVLALVVGSALLFFAIGKVGASPDEGDEQPTAAATDAATAPAATASTPPAATQEPAAVVTGGESAPPAEVVTGDPSSAPTEASTPDPDRLDPAEISVQVLDAILDGSTTAQDYADQMETDGYDLVASIRSGRVYDQTTVFYSSGQEAKAQQIADDYGWTLLRANDVGLSEDVDVGVVVGVSQD